MTHFKTLTLLYIVIRFLGCSSSQPVEQESPEENMAPSISAIGNQTISCNSQLGPLDFTIHDRESDPDSLKLYASSGNTSLVDTSDICFGGSKENRTLIICPRPGVDGQVIITLYVSDGLLTDSTSFLLTIVPGEETGEYPTMLSPLSAAELDQLKTELKALAGSTYRVSLNQYGLMEKGGTISRGSSAIKDRNVAIRQAKTSLLYLKKFTNVSDSSELTVREATNEHGAPLFDDWLIIFENQVYQGFDVMQTEIMVFINDQSTQIKGYHFKDIDIPANNRINQERARQLAEGYIIHYYDWGGEQAFEITEESIIDDLNMVILPIESEDTIELRLTWRIPVSTEYMFGSTMADFYAFMDVLYGQIIDVWQLVKY